MQRTVTRAEHNRRYLEQIRRVIATCHPSKWGGVPAKRIDGK